VQTVHSGILSGAPHQPEPDIHSLNQRFIRAAAVGDLATVENILTGGPATTAPAAASQEFVPLPDRYLSHLNFKIHNITFTGN
jgi:hypothetical protein